MFQYKTRGGRSPQGLQKVYFTCHPEDHSRYFESVSDMILKEQNCAVFYNADQGEYEDMETDLGQMQLFVIPVTTRLLTKKNRTLDVDLPFAIRKHIPVLPLMMEEGLEELYAKHFGDLHFLSPNKQDDTAITFEEKFKKYLGSVLVGDEMAEKVRKAFDAYIFLSYRKKDRAFAQKLMRLIHKNDFCRDIAIWYDEFLTPGEDFNSAIGAAMEKSKLFALVVTPHLLEKNDRGEPNYVMSTEYPEARKRGKTVLPAEMDPTDGEKLAEGFEGIDSTVNSDDEAELAAALHKTLAEYAKAENDDDPEHNFFIGLAYLGGIDVETDHARALELITFAAEHERPVPEAIEKLVSMYENGEGVERDYHKAIEWQRKLVAVYEKRAEKEPNYNNCLELINAVWVLGNKLEAVGRIADAEEAYKRMFALCEQHKAELGKSFQRCLSVSLNNLGDVRKAQGDIQGAEEYYSRSLKIDEQLAEETGTVESRRDLSISLDNLGDIREARGELLAAEKYYSRSLEIREQLANETGTVEARRDLSVSLNNLGNIHESLGDIKGAEHYYSRSLTIREQLADETGTIKARRDLAVSFSSIGDIREARGDLRGAKDYHLRSLKILEQLACETGTVQARRDLATCLNNLGNICESLDDIHGAEEYYLRSLKVNEFLARETGTIEARRDLSTSYSNLGYILTSIGDIRSAEEYGLRSLKIFEQIAGETGTPQARRELAVSLNNLGIIRKALGDIRSAEEYYSRSLEIRERLADETRTDEAYVDLAVSLFNCATLRKPYDRNKLSQVYGICRWLARNCPDVLKYAQFRDKVARLLGIPEGDQ